VARVWISGVGNRRFAQSGGGGGVAANVGQTCSWGRRASFGGGRREIGRSTRPLRKGRRADSSQLLLKTLYARGLGPGVRGIVCASSGSAVLGIVPCLGRVCYSADHKAPRFGRL